MPGLGLSGLFVLLSALALPLARRRGHHRRKGRLFWLAVIMAAAIMLTWEAIFEAYTALNTAAAVPAHPQGGILTGHGPWQLPIVAVSAAIMVLVIAAGEALLQLVGARLTPTPPPVESALPPQILLDHTRTRKLPTTVAARAVGGHRTTGARAVGGHRATGAGASRSGRAQTVSSAPVGTGHSWSTPREHQRR